MQPVLQRARGELALSFAVAAGGTQVAELYQTDPCRVLTPAPDPGEPQTAMLITTAGGLTGGDSLRVAVAVQAGADALCTPQAAEKIYRSAGEAAADIDLGLRVEAGARLEWLPQEMILFDGARLKRQVRIDLAADATLLAGDITVFGRGARGERFSRGFLLDRWQVRRDGRLIWADATRLDDDPLTAIDDPAGFDGAAAQALILCQGPQAEERRDAVRAAAQAAAMQAGATILEGLLLIRLLDRDAARLRRHFAVLWSLLRSGLERPSHMPRHWQF